MFAVAGERPLNSSTVIAPSEVAIVAVWVAASSSTCSACAYCLPISWTPRSAWRNGRGRRGGCGGGSGRCRGGRRGGRGSGGRGRHGVALGVGDRHRLHVDPLLGCLAGFAPGRDGADRLEHVQTLDHVGEARVRPGRPLEGQVEAVVVDEEELRAGGVRAGVGHRDRPRRVALGLGQRELVGQAVADLPARGVRPGARLQRPDGGRVAEDLQGVEEARLREEHEAVDRDRRRVLAQVEHDRAARGLDHGAVVDALAQHLGRASREGVPGARRVLRLLAVTRDRQRRVDRGRLARRHCRPGGHGGVVGRDLGDGRRGRRGGAGGPGRAGRAGRRLAGQLDAALRGDAEDDQRAADQHDRAHDRPGQQRPAALRRHRRLPLQLLLPLGLPLVLLATHCETSIIDCCSAGPGRHRRGSSGP